MPFSSRSVLCLAGDAKSYIIIEHSEIAASEIGVWAFRTEWGSTFAYPLDFLGRSHDF